MTRESRTVAMRQWKQNQLDPWEDMGPCRRRKWVLRVTKSWIWPYQQTSPFYYVFSLSRIGWVQVIVFLIYWHKAGDINSSPVRNRVIFTQAGHRVPEWDPQNIILFNYSTLLSQHLLPEHPTNSSFRSTHLATIAALMEISLLACALQAHSNPTPTTPTLIKMAKAEARFQSLILSDLKVRSKQIRCFAQISYKIRIKAKCFKLLMSEL